MSDRTFKIDFKRNKIQGFCSQLEEMKQAVHLALSVPRFEHEIFSRNYGSDFYLLIGQTKEYVLGDIRRMAEECLLIDDRIQAVNQFDLQYKQDSLKLSFLVVTLYGDIEVEKEVIL